MGASRHSFIESIRVIHAGTEAVGALRGVDLFGWGGRFLLGGFGIELPFLLLPQATAEVFG